MGTVNLKVAWAQSAVLMVLAVSLPLSTSVISIAAILVAVLWLLEGNYGQRLYEIFTNPVCLTVLLFLAYLLLGLLWSDNLEQGLEVVSSRWKIALMPVFLTAVCYQKRSWYLVAFVAGVTLAMVLTYLAWFGLIQYADVTPTHLTKRTFHVVYNPMLALAIYLVLHQLLWGKKSGIQKVGLGGLALVMGFNMFITEGRTGQLVFFVLLALLCFQYYKKHCLRAVLLICILLPLLFVAMYHLNPTFNNRIEQARTEVATFDENPNTSVGLRLQYWKNSWEIIKEAPLFGVGTGDFVDAYARVNSIKSPGVGPTVNPHNQYILVLCNGGIVGLFLVLMVFLVQLWQARVRIDGWQRIRVALPLFFLVIMFTESYLVVYETGFVFSLFSAVLFKREPLAL